eukprot:1155665-Pelagomonas_calceolata.AAC.4
MPIGSRSLPYLLAVRYVAMQIAFTELPLDVLIQQGVGCTPIGTMPVLAPASKPSVKAVPEHITQDFPDWLFPNGIGSSARHQSRPRAVFVRSIPGRPDHLEVSNVSPQDRDVHLFEFCPDTIPFSALEDATAQHANTIARLKTRSLGNPNTKDRVTLHITLIGVSGTFYNGYTTKPLINFKLGLSRQKAKLIGPC